MLFDCFIVLLLHYLHTGMESGWLAGGPSGWIGRLDWPARLLADCRLFSGQARYWINSSQSAKQTDICSMGKFLIWCQPLLGLAIWLAGWQDCGSQDYGKPDSLTARQPDKPPHLSTRHSLECMLECTAMGIRYGNTLRENAPSRARQHPACQHKSQHTSQPEYKPARRTLATAT